MPPATVSSAEVVDRRRARSLRTREALEEAALRLVVAQGFDTTTIDEIATAAGVSARTFFRHFDTKEDVLLGNQSERIARLRELLTERPVGEPVLTSLREAILSLATDDERRRDYHLIRARIAAEAPSVRARATERRAEWEDVMAEFVSERIGVDPDADLRPRLVAGATVAALRTARDNWIASQGGRHLPELTREALELLDRDFGLPEPELRRGS